MKKEAAVSFEKSEMNPTFRTVTVITKKSTDLNNNAASNSLPKKNFISAHLHKYFEFQNNLTKGLLQSPETTAVIDSTDNSSYRLYRQQQL